jgi:hypothetical protein
MRGEWWTAFENGCGAGAPPHAAVQVPVGVKRIEEAPGSSIVPGFLAIANAACVRVTPPWRILTLLHYLPR